MTTSVKNAQPESGRPPVIATATAVLANVLEFYDFAVYAYVAGIIGKVFFPSHDPVTSLMSAFAVFGVGYLARPLGGIVIGRMGDVMGRKPALIFSFVLMAVSTFATGLIPGYATIGIAAPVLIVLARLLQGFSVGGEAGNAMAFIVEWASPNKRGLYGSLQQSSSTSGFLLGSVIVAWISMSVSPAAMSAWGWRIPFFLGSLIGPVGLYMSRHVEETPAFRDLHETRGRLALPSETSPWLLVARAFSFTILWTVAYYVFLVYMPTFTKTYAHLSQSEALWSNAVGLIAVILVMPLVGVLSDRVGRKPLLLASSLCFLVLPYPIFSVLLSGASLAEIMAAQVVFGIALALISGIGPATISEIFPTHNRSTLMSIGYALAVAIFGGFAPFIATSLIAVSGIPIAPVFFVMAAAIIGLIVTAWLKETAHAPLR